MVTDDYPTKKAQHLSKGDLVIDDEKLKRISTIKKNRFKKTVSVTYDCEIGWDVFNYDDEVKVPKA